MRRPNLSTPEPWRSSAAYSVRNIPNTLSTTNSLASLYDDEGKYAQAERLFASTLEVQRRLLGEEHIETLETMTNLGNLYRTEGKYAQSESLLTRTLEIQRRVLGEEHVDTVSVAEQSRRAVPGARQVCAGGTHQHQNSRNPPSLVGRRESRDGAQHEQPRRALREGR